MKHVQYNIDKNNWSLQPLSVLAKVELSFSKERLFLKYNVQESFIMANNSNYNSPVYQDSCVEFFVSFNKKEYYNFECNCIGTLLAQYGEGRENRLFLSPDVLSRVEVVSSLGTDPFEMKTGEFRWNLTVVIPKKVFCFSDIDDLLNINMYGNFYKCGDNLPNRHHLSAFEILTDRPDFHRPEFFHKLV
jgi:hypothetical protein